MKTKCSHNANKNRTRGHNKKAGKSYQKPADQQTGINKKAKLTLT